MSLSRRQLLQSGLAGLTLPPLAACTTMNPSTPGLHAQSADIQVLVRAHLRYWLYLPRAVATEPGRRWPVMFFLHGSGERGDDLARVKVHGPPKYAAAGTDYPFVLVAPQVPEGLAWDSDALEALRAHLLRQLPIDADRVLMTGLSMGGIGTWNYAVDYPDRLAGIAPVSGTGDSDRAARVARLPIWAFHGERDDAVPIAGEREMVEAVRAAGGRVKFTVYPDIGHNAWDPAYADPQLYEWLLAQRRGVPG